jgi:hypothetical protein
MSEAPERIWLTGFVKDEYGARLGRGTISDLDHGQNPDYPEYVRADRIEELEAKLANAEIIIRIIASDKWDERLGEATDLSCEYLAELKGEK